MNASDVASIAAAVAAVFSALAAFLSWHAQRLTIRHTFRPEIQITTWNRGWGLTKEVELLTFRAVRNIGRDTAQQILISGTTFTADGRLLSSMSTMTLDSLGAGREVEIYGEVHLHWYNATQLPNSKVLHVPIQVWYWDAIGLRHETLMRLSVFEEGKSLMSGAVELCPDVYLTSQSSRSSSVLRLKVRTILQRIPVIGRIFRVK